VVGNGINCLAKIIQNPSCLDFPHRCPVSFSGLQPFPLQYSRLSMLTFLSIHRSIALIPDVQGLQLRRDYSENQFNSKYHKKSDLTRRFKSPGGVSCMSLFDRLCSPAINPKKTNTWQIVFCQPELRPIYRFHTSQNPVDQRLSPEQIFQRTVIFRKLSIIEIRIVLLPAIY